MLVIYISMNKYLTMINLFNKFIFIRPIIRTYKTDIIVMDRERMSSLSININIRKRDTGIQNWFDQKWKLLWELVALHFMISSLTHMLYAYMFSVYSIQYPSTNAAAAAATTTSSFIVV